MADVDAVIAALRVAAAEAEASDENYWKVSYANRWIAQLPGSRFGRLRKLKLEGDFEESVERELFVSHARAVVAFLEANRDAIKAKRFWVLWPRAKLRQPAMPPVEPPIDAEFHEVEPGRGRVGKPKKGVRLIK